ncbi:isopentenyl-diphosphate Delta-isomerase [Rhizobium leguminosarum]|uniref:isopentenyl-diphosphate Delta-isomerase n=1 Tax=Rhizobium leguminosarum TaxID=384 RepID=UPI00102F5AA3|nr:isopentenyl-diphosphate Delta-isomerase [Rhizobium leguminosarum]TBG85551.1 isopentenyl-diphosphate Delta-isomerase [Rhizobium leguminosarum]
MTDVLLVDRKDNVTGRAEKVAAHKLGLLHRAFSIFVTNGRDELLFQRRAWGKYHSGGIWANSCCGHPERDDVSIEVAAQQRLYEELGIEVLLFPLFTTIYRAAVEPAMVEFEFVHCFWGVSDGTPRPDTKEVSQIAWHALDQIPQLIDRHESNYAPWLVHYVRRCNLVRHLKQQATEPPRRRT